MGGIRSVQRDKAIGFGLVAFIEVYLGEYGLDIKKVKNLDFVIIHTECWFGLV